MCALSFFRRPTAVCPALVLALVGVCWSPAAMAGGVSCDAWTSILAFGDVNLLNSSVVDSSVTLTIGCNASPGAQVLVCVGMGANPSAPGMGSVAPRYLKSNDQTSNLAFNLYSDPARTNIWGDFGSVGYQPQAYVLQFSKYYMTETPTLYGRIKAEDQTNPSAVYYGGSWVMHLRYKSFTGATPDCSSGGMSEKTVTYTISATVKSDCRIDAVSNLDFGTVYQTLNQNIDSTATLTVTCVSRTPYKIALSNGLYPDGSQRQMQGPGGALLKYGLFTDAARADPWPSEPSMGVPQPSSNQPQQITVYGRVPPQTVATPGVYSDTVNVTVTY